MNPNEHPKRLIAYLDGELSAAESREIEGHLSGCEECARELSAHRKLHAYLDAADPTPVRGELWDELQPRLVEQPAAGGRLAWAGYVAMVVLGLGLGAWAGWSMGEESVEGSSPEPFAETSLYDLPSDGVAGLYLDETNGSEVRP